MSSQPVSLLLSFCQPILTVDVVEGDWFAVVSDGASRVEVVEWPVEDLRLDTSSTAVVRIDFFLAEGREHFSQGSGRLFAEVHVPASEAEAASSHGGGWHWLGLQRGMHHTEVDVEEAGRVFRAGKLLALNLLCPKLRLSLHSRRAACDDSQEVIGVQSLVEHSNIIVRMHQQLRTLWSEGRLTISDAAGLKEDDGSEATQSGLAAYLRGIASSVENSEMGRMRERVQKLADTVAALTTALHSCENLRRCFRERLEQLGEEASVSFIEQEVERAIAPWQFLLCQEQLEGQEDARGQAPHEAEARALRQELQEQTAKLTEAWQEQDRLRALAGAEAPGTPGSQGREAIPKEVAELLLHQRQTCQEAAATVLCETERRCGDALDTAHGELDEVRGALRLKTSELQRHILQVREEFELERRSLGEVAARRETEMRLEIRELEEASAHFRCETEHRQAERQELEQVRQQLKLAREREEVTEASARKGFSLFESRITKIEAQLVPSAVAAVAPVQRPRVFSPEHRSRVLSPERGWSPGQLQRLQPRAGVSPLQLPFKVLPQQPQNIQSPQRQVSANPTLQLPIQSAPLSTFSKVSVAQVVHDLPQAREKVAAISQELQRVEARARERWPEAVISDRDPPFEVVQRPPLVFQVRSASQRPATAQRSSSQNSSHRV